jgi:hypothetical protein
MFDACHEAAAAELMTQMPGAPDPKVGQVTQHHQELH